MDPPELSRTDVELVIEPAKPTNGRYIRFRPSYYTRLKQLSRFLGLHYGLTLEFGLDLLLVEINKKLEERGDLPLELSPNCFGKNRMSKKRKIPRTLAQIVLDSAREEGADERIKRIASEMLARGKLAKQASLRGALHADSLVGIDGDDAYSKRVGRKPKHLKGGSPLPDEGSGQDGVHQQDGRDPPEVHSDSERMAGNVDSQE